MQKIISSKDISRMREALRLAGRGLGRVHPNPLVGAVLEKNGRIIGKGFHQKFGGPHAEVITVRSASSSPNGATLYVTLEPCAHFGKTPPCTDFILKNKIKKVVIGAIDPNPLVSGKGVRALRRAGIKVVTGVLEKEAAALNKDFNHWVSHKMPYGVVKVAESLDGKIATKTGESQWITGKEARNFSHHLRAESDAIMVGVNTVLKDDPLLNVRIKTFAQPLKVILDTSLKTPLNARIFSKDSPGPVLLAVANKVSKPKIAQYRNKAEIVVAKTKSGRVDMVWLMKLLARKGTLRVLIEGGSETIADAFKSRVVNEVYFFMAPKIIGGRKAVSSVGGDGITHLKEAVKIKNVEVRMIGEDLMIHGVL